MGDFLSMLQALDPQKRAAVVSMIQQMRGGAPQPGMFSAAMQAPQAPAQPEKPLPGAASPAEAAKAQADAARRAGRGLFGAAGREQGANMFAGNPEWFSGLIDTTTRRGPFDSFFVDNSRSDTWL